MDLEKALDLLGSDEAKKKASIKLYLEFEKSNNAKIFPKKYLNYILEYHEERKEFHDAAKIAKELGMENKTRELYSKVVYLLKDEGKYKLAIDAAEESGMKEEFKELYAAAVENCEKNNDYWSAIKFAKKANMVEKTKSLYEAAIDYYEKKEDYTQAASFAKDAGWEERAEALSHISTCFPSCILDKDSEDEQ